MNVILTMGEPLMTFAISDRRPFAVRAHVAGAEINTAVGLSRQGVAVRFFSRLGDDALADAALAALEDAGVDTSSAVRAVGERTGLIVTERVDDHEMRSEHFRSGTATSRLSPVDIPGDLLDGVASVHLTGIVPALGDGPRAAWEALIRQAVARGIPVSLDVNHRPQLIDDDGLRSVVGGVIDRIATLFCNEAEALVLTGEADPRRALAALVARGPGTVVLKLGRRGVLASLPDGRVLESGSFDVPLPTHPVGAGDAFNAGWLGALLAGTEPEIALPLAAWIAARVVAHPADHDGFPSATEIDGVRTALLAGDLEAPPFDAPAAGHARLPIGATS